MLSSRSKKKRGRERGRGRRRGRGRVHIHDEEEKEVLLKPVFRKSLGCQPESEPGSRAYKFKLKKKEEERKVEQGGWIA